MLYFYALFWRYAAGYLRRMMKIAAFYRQGCTIRSLCIVWGLCISIAVPWWSVVAVYGAPRCPWL